MARNIRRESRKELKGIAGVVAECVVATSNNSKSWDEPNEFTNLLDTPKTKHNQPSKWEAKALAMAGKFLWGNNLPIKPVAKVVTKKRTKRTK